MDQDAVADASDYEGSRRLLISFALSLVGLSWYLHGPTEENKGNADLLPPR